MSMHINTGFFCWDHFGYEGEWGRYCLWEGGCTPKLSPWCLHSPNFVIMTFTFFWPLHPAHHTFLAPAVFALDPLVHSTWLITLTWPLHVVHYVFLTPAVCTLHILKSMYHVFLNHSTLYIMYSNPRILCIMNSWPLQSMYYIFLTPTHCAVCTPKPFTLCIKQSLNPLCVPHCCFHLGAQMCLKYFTILAVLLVRLSACPHSKISTLD